MNSSNTGVQDESTLRSILNKYPAVIGAVIAVAIGVMVYLNVKSPPKPQAFFSTDDGKSWFTLDRTTIPPVSHHGKEAYRVAFYTCDDGKTRFVGYLTRFTGDQREKAIAEMKAGALRLTAMPEIRKPGETKWIPPSAGGGVRTSARESVSEYDKILDVRCPDGSAAFQIMDE